MAPPTTPPMSPPPLSDDHTPTRKERYFLALNGMRAVDVISGGYWASTRYAEKHAWIAKAWESPTITEWLNVTAWPSLVVVERERDAWALSRSGLGLVLELGPKYSDDLNLASAFAQMGRMGGIFPNAQRTKGFAYDSVTVTLTAMALHTHDPARAREFLDLTKALGLHARKPPHGTWKPKTW